MLLPGGSSDQEIISHARATNQVVVTSNHDMILLCLEQQQSVIWLDPHGRKVTRDEMVVLVFQGARQWKDLFQSATEPVCIRALRTKNERLPAEGAVQMVKQRMKRIAAKKLRLTRFDGHLQTCDYWSREGSVRCRRRERRIRRSSARRWFAWCGLVGRLVS